MSIQERWAEFLRRANTAAKELGLEIEFTTRYAMGYSASDSPCIEILATGDAIGYMEVEGRLTIG